MLTDIEIAQQAELRLIKDVAADLGIKEEELEPYGRYKAKLSDELANRLEPSTQLLRERAKPQPQQDLARLWRR